MGPGVGKRPFGLLSVVLAVAAATSCGRESEPTTSTSPAFDGTLTCPDGETVGGIGWDYGPDIEGFVDDPVAWVRDNGSGLHEDLTLSLLATAGDREDVIIATRDDGVVLLLVDFGQQPAGAYFPVEGEACPSSGLEDFNKQA